MFTGTLPPISPGETYEETLELIGDDDAPVSKAFLDACTVDVVLLDQNACPIMTGAASSPADGILILTLPSTSSLRPGLPRLCVRLTKDGVTDTLLSAALPITQG